MGREVETTMVAHSIDKFIKMFKKEKKEHPKLPAWAVRQIVSDHMKKMK